MTDRPRNIDDITAILRDVLPELRERWGVERLGVFGSWARGEQSAQSDIDILVEFSKPTFDGYMETKFFLEERFGVNVDLVLADNVKTRIKPQIERDTVYA